MLMVRGIILAEVTKGFWMSCFLSIMKSNEEYSFSDTGTDYLP